MGIRFSFLFFLIFTLLICFGIIFRGEVLFTGDNSDLLFPQKHFWVNEVTNGRIPLWNPYILSGTPYFADINLGTLAPSNLIYLIVSPVEKAASLLFVIELFIIGFFTYLCARQYKISQLGSVISGLVFMCSGVILIYITNLAIFNVIVYLPVIVFFLEKALQKKSWNLVLFCGLLTTAQIVSGHAQITYYTGLLIAFLVLTREKRKTPPARGQAESSYVAALPPLRVGGGSPDVHRDRLAADVINLTKKIKILLTIFLVALGLSAIQILPFLEFTKYTPRVNQSYQWATEGSLRIIDLIKFIWPKFVWSFSGWIDFSSKVNLGYIGVVPFLLFLIGLTSQERRWRILAVIVLLSLLAALGRNTPVYRLFYLLLPGISSLKVPSQTISIYSFVAALFAGKGLDLLKEKASFLRLKNRQWTLLLFFIFLTLLFLSIFLIWKIPLLENLFSSFKLAVWFINFLFLIQFVLLFLISWLFINKHRSFLGRTIILVSLMVDLFLSAKTVLLTAPSLEVTAENRQSNLVVSPSQRIYTIPPIQKPTEKIFNPSVEKIFSREKYDLLLPNQNIYQKVYALDGYASMGIASYINEFTDAAKTVTGLGKLDVSLIDFKNKGVSFILSQEEVPYFKNNDQFLLVQAKKPVVYKVVNSRNRYFLEDNGEIEFINEDSTQLLLRVKSNQPTKLILLDTYFPGWKAFVDNQEVLINRYENTYRSIIVPYGQHLIQFKYLPVSYYWGKIISLFSFMAVFLLFMFNKTKKI